MAFEKQSKGTSRVENTAGSRTVQPTREEIAKRAYELFLARGAEHGHHEEDWLRAERELSPSRHDDPVVTVKKPTLVRPS
jgi:hypothetical protein